MATDTLARDAEHITTRTTPPTGDQDGSDRPPALPDGARERGFPWSPQDPMTHRRMLAVTAPPATG